VSNAQISKTRVRIKRIQTIDLPSITWGNTTGETNGTINPIMFV